MAEIFGFSLVFWVAAIACAGEPVSLFDGKTLDGWDGDPKFWSVEDGAITGKTTPDNPTPGNTFLIWRKGELEDFELHLKFRITGGNSGIQFRSKDRGGWSVGGYQADFDASSAWTGVLFEEGPGGRTIVAGRGKKVAISETGERTEVAATASEQEILNALRKEGAWNDYVVIARGNQITLKVNGVTTAEVIDSEEGKSASRGILALQLHAGPPMEVQVKDVLLTKLK